MVPLGSDSQAQPKEVKRVLGTCRPGTLWLRGRLSSRIKRIGEATFNA